MLPRDIPMSLSVVQLAGKQEGLSAIALVVVMALIGLSARCIMRYVLSVAKSAKCPSSLEKADPYIAVIATGRLG
jgi:hypothetical protein